MGEDNVKKALPARSTRGQRMHQLLDEEKEADEEFWKELNWEEEVESDEEFLEEDATDVEDEEPDSDFFDSEESGEEEGAGEAALDDDDKRRKRGRDAEPFYLQILKKKKAQQGKGEAGASNNERKTRLRPESKLSAARGDIVKKTPMRESTRKVIELQQEKEKERERLKKKMPKVVKEPVKVMTQEELLAEAMVTEEENKKSLEKILQFEETKKKAAKARFRRGYDPKHPSPRVVYKDSNKESATTLTFLHLEKFSPSFFDTCSFSADSDILNAVPGLVDAIEKRKQDRRDRVKWARMQQKKIAQMRLMKKEEDGREGEGGEGERVGEITEKDASVGTSAGPDDDDSDEDMSLLKLLKATTPTKKQKKNEGTKKQKDMLLSHSPSPSPSSSAAKKENAKKSEKSSASVRVPQVSEALHSAGKGSTNKDSDEDDDTPLAAKVFRLSDDTDGRKMHENAGGGIKLAAKTTCAEQSAAKEPPSLTVTAPTAMQGERDEESKAKPELAVSPTSHADNKSAGSAHTAQEGKDCVKAATGVPENKEIGDSSVAAVEKTPDAEAERRK
uniref:Vps72/YL1 N-terminal domain-containing protein n=1 Tax=Palpitomonas bilix TaxID=652834 RepID=A0A7S3GI03_9EUKA|mmetsp:Transcript_50179/g.129141  ORF Transcript_50179/g.129141 Transcript_50179/m.129141 type:complete len:562 (+) Transcript_50179:267-1952(+)